MTESPGGTSASATQKEKKSLLDEEIGKDFLSSWKSMSVAEDDVMDFSFDTISTGKKKFNFDKLDMDFDLDGNFDKLSSFKVDMSDLDFSCPSKKTSKTKIRTEEDPSSGNRRGTKDHFSFSFDFNDEDFANDAQIGRNLVGNSKSLVGELPDKEPVLLRNEKNPNDLSSSSEGLNSDGLQSGSKLVGDLGLEDKQVTQEEPSMLGSDKNTGEDLHASDVQIGSELEGNSMSVNKELTMYEPVLLGSENNIKNLTDVREDTESNGIKNETKPVGDVKVQDKQASKPVMRGNEKSIGEDFYTNDAQINNKVVGSEFLSRELMKNEPVSQGSEKNVKSLSNISKVVNADGVQNGSKVGNSRPQDEEATTEPVTLRSEKTSGEDFNTKDAQISNKLVGSKSLSRELKKNEPLSLGSEKNLRSLSNIRRVINADGVQNGSKLGNLRPKEIEARTGELVMPRNEKSSGFQVNPSSLNEKTTNSSTKASGNSKVLSTRSFRNLKNASVEGLKSDKRTTDLSSLKNLRSIEANNMQTLMKLSEITTFSISHSIDGTQKQKPLTPSLKRKIIEEPNADLVSKKPIKCLSESPKDSRNFNQSLGRVVEEQVCNHENQGQSKTKNFLHDHLTSGIEVSQDVSITQLEIPLVLESDGNVEKAKAYAKELEDICSMLKKKHEEAKEVLVRAVVNNNNLLMLNHPIYEEKIRMVQKFATELMSKEIPT